MPEVTLSERACRDIDDAHNWWAENRSTEQADRWYRGLVQRVFALEEAPQRCGLAPENSSFPYEIRQLLFGLRSKPTHRVVFTIRSDQIIVLRVRHVAQGPLRVDEI